MLRCAFVALALTTSTLAAGAPVRAQVTGCQTVAGVTQVSLKCSGTTATPPYTTQYRVKAWCQNGTITYSIWRTAGSGLWSTATCSSGISTHIKQFQ